MIGLCFVLTWLRLKSGSLWTGIILHASRNHFIQQFFDPMTSYTGRRTYVLKCTKVSLESPERRQAV
jgi:hypothetical protein